MQDIIIKIRKSLSQYYPESEISGFVRLIMEHTTGLSMPFLLSDKSTKITEVQALKIDKIVERLATFEPIQYILGETEFYGLPFIVNNNVLIPRPETEELVEIIINENHDSKLDVLDIGTGSGCIAISLKKNLKNSTLQAWDISSGALDVAISNSKKNSTEITFRRVDILADYPTENFFDIIVSNPPYVLETEKTEMDLNVLDFEPHTALFVSDDNPLLFYKRIADIAKDRLKSKGKLYFEINSLKGQETMDMLSEKGFSNIQSIKDISGKDRIVKADYSRES